METAKEYFRRDEYDDFSGFFQEEQYLIPLWAAHMLIEHGSPDKGLSLDAVKGIRKYSDNPLSPDVAKQE